MASYKDRDSDDSRLPHGMTRTGYDADTQTYSYADANGAVYEGSPGNRYGLLHPTGRFQVQDPANSSHANIPFRVELRYLAPFLLLVGIYLILVLKWSFQDGGACDKGYQKYHVSAGDTCFAIARKFGTSVEMLRGEVGEKRTLDCDLLQIGQGLCVPVKG